MYITSGMTIRSVNYYNLSRPIHPCRQLADGHQGSSEGALGIALDILGLNTSGIHGKTIGKSLGKPSENEDLPSGKLFFRGFIWDLSKEV